MRWIVIEHLIKGLFLGLLAYAALALPTPAAAAIVAACLVGGLSAGLVVAALRSVVRPAGRATAYLLFLLLEFPQAITGGLLLGLALGIRLAPARPVDPALLPTMAGAGLVLGAVSLALKVWPGRWTRLGLAVGTAVLLVAGGLYAIDRWPDFIPEADRPAIGMYLLLGLPFFYLLTFVGEAEETEVEVALWCTAIAVGVWLVKATPGLPVLAFLIPVSLFYVYTSRVLPGLRVFKHTLRGISYGRVGLPADALAALGRAVALDPTNSLARAALWEVHRQIDPAAIDDRLLGMIDPGLCLARVDRLLASSPTAEQASEARQLLDLVAKLGPAWTDRVRYWRAVAATHAGDIDAAAAHLTPLLEPGHESLAAWQLALVLHPALEQRVGRPALEMPGRRLAAIAVVERTLEKSPDDPTAWMLKRVLYAPLTAAEFCAGSAGPFDAGYVEQLGRALLDDPTRVRRAAEFLGIAAEARPEDAPRLAQLAADALDQHGDRDAARDVRRAGRRAGATVGVRNLNDTARASYFAVTKSLAESALVAKDWAEAADCLRDYAESDQSGIETLRTLAECHERLGDPLAALAATARGLVYNKADADLLARRDRYTYSVLPDQLQSEAQKTAIDADYCMARAKEMLDSSQADAEQLDWARHLAELATVVRPAAITAQVLRARAALRLGDRDTGLQLLEDIREQKPAAFASTAEEEAWLFANRLLGDMYLNDLDRADLAVGCFLDYRKSSRSGADTLYKLGLAYERSGQRGKAAGFFEQAASYDGHPIAPDARAGLSRVRS
ncbi:MAG: hypothetical protein K1X57_14295 [Gemmataceae bacterium]|nr:hypothetical protein [Gemmataceae bacterium]